MFPDKYDLVFVFPDKYLVFVFPDKYCLVFVFPDKFCLVFVLPDKYQSGISEMKNTARKNTTQRFLFPFMADQNIVILQIQLNSMYCSTDTMNCFGLK